MAFTEIDAAALRSDHLGRQVRISWQKDDRGATFGTSVHGVLEHIAHSREGTTVAVDIGPLEVTLDESGLAQAQVEINEDDTIFGRQYDT